MRRNEFLFLAVNLISWCQVLGQCFVFVAIYSTLLHSRSPFLYQGASTLVLHFLPYLHSVILGSMSSPVCLDCASLQCNLSTLCRNTRFFTASRSSQRHRSTVYLAASSHYSQRLLESKFNPGKITSLSFLLDYSIY